MQTRTRIYLDHAAATPLRPEARAAMEPFGSEWFGNGSSPYEISRRARAAVEKARAQVAALLGCFPDEIAWTSGGTEADNWALWGVALACLPARGHILTSAIEHHAVLEPAVALRDLGFETSEAPPDADGVVSCDALLSMLRPDTRVVSLMLCNNETGVLQPVAQVGAALKNHAALLHTDATQAAGRVKLDVNALGCDLLTLSGHKLGGPKGVGALYIRRGTRMKPLLRGGAQERGRRAGTENVPGIVGMGAACELAARELEAESARLTGLRGVLEDGLQALGASVNGAGAMRASHITNATLPGRSAEMIALNLDMRGFAVGTGSACASGALEPSHVLRAMGRSDATARASLRISLGRANTLHDVEALLTALCAMMARRSANAQSE